MKRQQLILLTILCCLCFQSRNVFASTQTALSHIILLPGERPHRIELPDISNVLEVSSVRVLPPGARLASEATAPVTILCPDLTIHEILPGQLIFCPEVTSSKLVVELSPPPPRIYGLEPTRGPAEPLFLSAQDTNTLTAAQQEIEALALASSARQLLLASLHATYKHYREAVQILEPLENTSQDPGVSRSLGTYYLELADYKKAWRSFQHSLELAQEHHDCEGEAVAQHYLAMILAAFEQEEEARQRGQEALKRYQQLGMTTMVERVQQLLDSF